MCRVIAIPGGIKKKEALEIMLNFEGFNKDGTGFVHLKDGKFVVWKSTSPLSELVKTKSFNALDHLPFEGWTIGHIRNATTGEVSLKNCHPFVIDNLATVHNGIFSEWEIVKLTLDSTIKPEWVSDTDSEVAIRLLNLMGPEKFACEINHSGIFLSLKRDGSLDIVKTSGDLVFYPRKGSTLIASELSYKVYDYKKQQDSLIGWYRFDKFGRYIEHKVKEEDKKEKKQKQPVMSRFYHHYWD